jgi:hypothetical protein
VAAEIKVDLIGPLQSQLLTRRPLNGVVSSVLQGAAELCRDHIKFRKYR